jgi:gliding motility-associated-like protein
MKCKIFILSYLLIIATVFNIYSQDVIQPESPVLDYVTVNPATGVATLVWISSISPDVKLYVIYSYSNATAYPIDTVEGKYAVTYDDYSSLARYKSVNYVVAAMDSSKNISPLSNALSTIYLSAVNDSCNNKIILQWNACVNQRHPVKRYSVFCSVNGVSAQPIDTVDLLYYNLTGYATDKKYCFYVKALNDDGVVSVSNMQCVKTGAEQAPGWIELTGIRIDSPVITIKGSYDTEGGITSFISEKKTYSSNTWAEIASGTGSSGSVSFSDANPDTTTISLYRISAVNNCGAHVTVSDPVRNIVLTAIRESGSVILKWNNPVPDRSSSFTIFRNTGNGYDEIATALTDTVYTDDYSAYAYNISGEKVTYRIKATISGTHSGTMEYRSSSAEVIVSANIRVGNAFTPNGDGENDIFYPALAFTPQYYEFTIYSRAGVVLYRSNNPGTGWDGRYNGTTMPPGTYLWTLRVKMPSGTIEKRNGTVAILP